MDDLKNRNSPDAAIDPQHMQVGHLVRLPAVLAATGMSKAWIYDAMARGLFPRPVRITKRAVGWRVDDIQKWQGGLELAIRK